MLSALQMSRHYALYLAAQLAGDDAEGVDFGFWLDAHWHDDVDIADELCGPDLLDAVANAGVIAWSDLDDEIIGVLVGSGGGCYRIARNARPPEIALLLDDVAGCSTGSIHQERAFLERDYLVPERSMAITRPQMTVPPLVITDKRQVPIPDRVLPQLTPDAGV